MRTLSLMKILALLGLALCGLAAPIGADPCDDPSTGVQENILGIVEVYDLDYQMNAYTQSSHRMTIENRTDAAVEYKYECSHVVVIDDENDNIIVADATREFGPHTVERGETEWHFETRTASLHNVRRNRNYILKTYTALRVTGGPSWGICREYNFKHR